MWLMNLTAKLGMELAFKQLESLGWAPRRPRQGAVAELLAHRDGRVKASLCALRKKGIML